MKYKKRKKISLAVVMISLLPFVVFMISAFVVLQLHKQTKGASAASNYWRAGILISVVCPLLAVIFLWLWEFRARITRSAQMQKLAEQLGFSYSQKFLIPPELKRYKLFVEFGRVYSKLSNVLRGVSRGLEVSIFDYRHSDYLSVNGKGQIWTYIDTLILIKSSNHPPSLFTYDEGLEIEEIKAKFDAVLETYHPETFVKNK